MNLSLREWLFRLSNAFMRRAFPDVPVVTVAELSEPGGLWKGALRLDARALEEYAVSHLPEAIPLGERPFHVPGRCVIYCSLGFRSARAARQLRQDRIEAFNLEGSLFAWANAGLPIERGGLPVREVHPYNWVGRLFLDGRQVKAVTSA